LHGFLYLPNEGSRRRPEDLPNVFVVGAAKAGTTALYQYFRTHPRIYVPRDLKETNYMAFQQGAPPLAGPGDRKFVTSITTLVEYRQLYRDGGQYDLAADVSPSYLYYSRAARRIAELSPTAKIVIVLRNPVECAFSMYAMMRGDGREPCADFSEAFGRSKERIQCGWEWAWDYQGAYRFARQVREYLSLFPRSQLFIARYEQLRDHPRAFYRELTRFLGIEALDVRLANQRVNTSPRRIDLMRRVKAGDLLYRGGKLAGSLLPPAIKARVNRYLAMPAYVLGPSNRQMLVDHFAPDIAELGRLLDWDLSDWV
jgi:hypothetical protein